MKKNNTSNGQLTIFDELSRVERADRATITAEVVDALFYEYARHTLAVGYLRPTKPTYAEFLACAGLTNAVTRHGVHLNDPRVNGEEVMEDICDWVKVTGGATGWR